MIKSQALEKILLLCKPEYAEGGAKLHQPAQDRVKREFLIVSQFWIFNKNTWINSIDLNNEVTKIQFYCEQVIESRHTLV